MAQINLLDTKIDAPAPDQKAMRRRTDAPERDDDRAFDRLVSRAAERQTSRGEAPAEASAVSDGPAESETPGDGTSQAPAQAGTTQTVEAPAPAAAQPRATAPADIVAVLLPISGEPIQVSLTAASVPVATPPTQARPIARAPMPAGTTVATIPPGAAIPADDGVAGDVATADLPADAFAGLLEGEAPGTALRPAAQQALQAPAANATGLPQRTTEAATVPAMAAAAALPTEPLADPIIETVRFRAAESFMPANSNARGAIGAPAAEPASAVVDEGRTDPPAGAVPAAREFVREAASQYQVAAETGEALRGAAEADAASQVSLRLIQSLHEGRKTVHMHLHPSELGSIDVALQWQGDRLTAHFTVERTETLELLQRDIKILEQSLGDSGFRSDDGGLSFSLRQQMEQQGERRQGAPAAEDAKPAAETPAADADSAALRDGVLVIRV